MIMEKNILTKVLAIVGTALVWFPILAPVVLTVPGFLIEHRVLFDYLMPAELFPVALVGSGLLMGAALRARSRRALVGGGLGVAAGSLVGGLALAVAAGFASGDAQPAGWLFALVVGAIAVYSLALVAIAVGGVLLVRDLFRPLHSRSPELTM
jgi:hypothetical protein